MANFKSKDILSVCATIIAGLLILLTIQAISTNPIIAKLAQIQDDLDSKSIILGSDIQTISYLKSELLQTKDNQTHTHIQNQIDDLQMQAWQLQAQINGIENQKSQWTSVTNQTQIAEHIRDLRYVILIMISPFAFTLLIEISSTTRKGNDTLNEVASRAGKESLFWSIIILLMSLFFLMSQWVL